MKTHAIIAAILAAVFLNLSGPNEPEWLGLAIAGLCLYAGIIVVTGFHQTLAEQREFVNPLEDEHRDHAI